MILDTSFLRDLKDKQSAALAHSRHIESLGVPLRIPTVVSFEWYYGVQYVEQPIQDQRRFQQLAANTTFQELTDSIARKAGTVNYPSLLPQRTRASVLEGGALMWTPGNQLSAVGR